MRFLSFICLGICTLSGAAFAFDRQTVAALKACHDHVWDLPDFTSLPNAAISVFPGMMDPDTIVINWNVNWDQPKVRAAGHCTVIDGGVAGFEDYTK